ncbi:MAG: hypothetical protein GTO02_21560, partial [Candidatus Dadabacteria bacterium]|nr:hypothetical protein [Candidatus Dadabacteria bacterium]
MNNRKVLVLNANYKPLCVITWQKAITLLCKENKNVSVNIVKYYKREIIKSSSGDLPAPSIIAINKYIDISKINVKLSKRNIIIRDNKTCQYCGTDLERKNS